MLGNPTSLQVVVSTMLSVLCPKGRNSRSQWYLCRWMALWQTQSRKYYPIHDFDSVATTDLFCVQRYRSGANVQRGDNCFWCTCLEHNFILRARLQVLLLDARCALALKKRRCDVNYSIESKSTPFCWKRPIACYYSCCLNVTRASHTYTDTIIFYIAFRMNLYQEDGRAALATIHYTLSILFRIG